MPHTKLGLKIKREKVLAGILTQARPLTGPRFVLFRINHTCNMKCQMCASFSELVPMEHRVLSHQDMPFELFTQLIDECVALDVERVSVGGEGEPSLHKRFFDMLIYAKEKGLEGTTITNGSMLLPKRVETLVDIGWDELNVSMNAGNRESHEKVTFTKTWDRIRDGLIHLKELKAERGTPYPRVRQSNTIFNTNYRSIVDMVRFAIETGADEMTIGLATLDDFENDGRHVLGLSAAEFAESRALLREAADLADTAPRLQTNVRDFLSSIEHESNHQRITESIQMKIPCTVGYWLAVIDPDGEVHPCCQCEDGLGASAQSKGTSFTELWYSDAYARFRQAARDLPTTGKSIDSCSCHSCDFTPANIMYYNKLHPLSKIDEASVSPRR
jgi:radical SAM protein with 4Fe4S-binding SPASM domain